jgi:hypothetical protein
MEASYALRPLGTFRHSFYDECLHLRADALFESSPTPSSARTPRSFSRSPERASKRCIVAAGAAFTRVGSRAGRRRSSAGTALVLAFRLLEAEQRRPSTPRGGQRACGIAAAMRRRAPSAACTTTLPATRPAGPSRPDGLTGSSHKPTSSPRECRSAPAEVRGVRPTRDRDTNEVAAEQVRKRLCSAQPRRRRRRRRRRRPRSPLFVFDAGYDPVEVHQGLVEGCVRARSLSV